MKLSGLREDTKYLKTFFRLYGEDMAQMMAVTPLMIVPDFIDKSKWGEYVVKFLDEGKAANGFESDCFDYFINDFCALVNLQEGKDDHVVHISYTKKSEVLISSMINMEIAKGLILIEVELRLEKGVWAVYEKSCIIKPDRTSSPFGVEKGKDKRFVQHISINAHRLLVLFHQFAFEQDQYLTEVRKAGKQLSRDKRTLHLKPWATRNLPRLIYLNKLPSESVEPQGGHHASPKPHHKIGFYKTLKADIFKHHPKYMEYKAVYVRPCFVGDKTKIFEGNRYTIITGDK